MLLVAVLAPFLVLATVVAAHPKVPNAIRNTHRSLPFSKHINVSGAISPVKKDVKRIGHFVKHTAQRVEHKVKHLRDATEEDPAPELNLTNVVMGYVAKVGVGNPPTYCESHHLLPLIVFYMPVLDSLIVDTGRAVTWVGANAPYKITNTSVNASESVVSILSYSDCWTSSTKLVDQMEMGDTFFFEGKFTSCKKLFTIFKLYPR